MSEQRALMNAILERPDDDLPRLVYADYLDETGGADRAEFIRVQLQLAKLDRGDERVADLSRREHELLQIGFGGYVPGVRGIQTFRRGFVESLDTTAERLIQAPKTLLLLAPIRELRIRNADNALDDLAKVPGLDRIESLDLRNNSFGTQDRVARFFDAAPLRSMSRLNLANNQLWSDNVERLVGCRWAPQLRSLDLSGNAIGDTGATVLARAESLRGLNTLILRSEGLDWRDRIQTSGARTLGLSQTLNELRNFDISGHLIGAEGLAYLVEFDLLPALESVDASANRIEFDPVSVANQAYLRAKRDRMRIWNLSSSSISLLAAEAFATWPQLETLDRLILEQCDWEPGAREVLAASPWAHKIRMGNPASGEQA